jgi:hypothetical protein
VPRDRQGTFDKPIYFSVFARSYVQYEITFEYTFLPEYNGLLEGSEHLGEAIPAFEALPDEYDERLYAYSPWWSGRENRTVVILADVLANNVFFYAEWNTFPKHFGAAMHDVDNVIAKYGD